MIAVTFSTIFVSSQSTTISVPEGFLWGAGVSEYQVSGAACCTDSNWSEWEKVAGKCKEKSGIACDFWNSYTEDIERMQALGLNAFRFSVEWCKIEPERGKFNKVALQHYSDVCDALIQASITPVITLHHFVNPIWFDNLGGFEKQENIKYFERFCAFVFKFLSRKVHMWCTINEPNIYAACGYWWGKFPPGKIGRVDLSMKVLRNLLEAHTRVFHRLKNMKYGKDAYIGLVHSYLPFQTYSSWNPLEYAVVKLHNYILNDLVINFLRTGECQSIYIKKYVAPKGKSVTDFIGLNYYSRILLAAELSRDIIKPSCYPNEIMTDMPYAMYSQGLYEAIVDLDSLGYPIYITENGLADVKDDRRKLFLEKYIGAMSKAIKRGCDVRGYFYWSFMDNFEWAEGYGMKFGLYEVDHITQKRTIRQSAYYYKEIIEQASMLA